MRVSMLQVSMRNATTGQQLGVEMVVWKVRMEDAGGRDAVNETSCISRHVKSLLYTSSRFLQMFNEHTENNSRVDI